MYVAAKLTVGPGSARTVDQETVGYIRRIAPEGLGHNGTEPFDDLLRGVEAVLRFRFDDVQKFHLKFEVGSWRNDTTSPSYAQQQLNESIKITT